LCIQDLSRLDPNQTIFFVVVVVLDRMHENDVNDDD
jgi:hypothetical protein